MMVRTASGTVGYEATGSGIPVVLLHGFPHDRALWRHQREAKLAGVKTITPDLPGFGQSTPAHPDGDMTKAPPASVEAWARWVVDFLDAMKLERVILGGLSMGGYLVLATWRLAPERIRALILADTRAGADDDEGKAKRRAMQALLPTEGAAAVATRMAPGMLGKTTRVKRPEIVAEVNAMMLRQPVRGLHDALDALMTRPDSTPTLATITVPTLIICGDEDVLTPEREARILVHGIAGSRLEMVGGAGHASCIEQPDAVTRLIAGFVEEMRES